MHCTVRRLSVAAVARQQRARGAIIIRAAAGRHLTCPASYDVIGRFPSPHHDVVVNKQTRYFKDINTLHFSTDASNDTDEDDETMTASQREISGMITLKL